MMLASDIQVAQNIGFGIIAGYYGGERTGAGLVRGEVVLVVGPALAGEPRQIGRAHV